ncbi:imelysin family protein [Pelistega ratti]|uniref:imelysin family protein n=1 Tax=Pelistega ratti TaxID=2652177 RepID=UPI00135A8A36|nr:imelysin family protein [Pelistega ratti]
MKYFNLKQFICLSLSSTMVSLASFSSSIAAPDLTQPLTYIYDEVILPNAQSAHLSCERLATALASDQKINHVDTVRPPFLQLIKDWKAVQTTYILGELNEEFLDTPGRIDIFKQGKEDWQAQLTRALNGTNDPKTALFKYSYRSINALEYILFQDEQVTEREQQFAHYITQSLCTQYKEIAQAYQDARPVFFNEPDKSLANIVHSLSSSIFSTKDWRIGDVAGLTRKYKNKPDLRRAEYALSGYSGAALTSIFATQQQVFAYPQKNGLQSILTAYDEAKLGQDIDHNLENILSILKTAKDDASLFTQANKLYDISNQLYQQYYISMIAALPVVAKVLDADGD